jgi:hypothetical protein
VESILESLEERSGVVVLEVLIVDLDSCALLLYATMKNRDRSTHQ